MCTAMPPAAGHPESRPRRTAGGPRRAAKIAPSSSPARRLVRALVLCLPRDTSWSAAPGVRPTRVESFFAATALARLVTSVSVRDPDLKAFTEAVSQAGVFSRLAAMLGPDDPHSCYAALYGLKQVLSLGLRVQGRDASR